MYLQTLFPQESLETTKDIIWKTSLVKIALLKRLASYPNPSFWYNKTNIKQIN